jgi:hypothetical protein
VRKDEAMIPVISSDETIQDVVCTALAADHAVDASLEMFTALQHEFPQATIVALSLSALLEAAYTAVQSVDE